MVFKTDTERRFISLLELEVGDRVADMFCGLGNFSLAIARRGGRVFGIESNQELIERAAYNAEVNGLSDRCEFLAANLFLEGCPGYKNLNAIDKLLIDQNLFLEAFERALPPFPLFSIPQFLLKMKCWKN